MTADSSVVWVLLCNPDNRRRQLYHDALQRQEQSNLIVISYLDLLNSVDSLEVLQRVLPNTTDIRLQVKIESPGECFAVEKKLIGLGAGNRLTPEQARNLEFDKGRFCYLQQWADGFVLLLNQFKSAMAQYCQFHQSQVHYLNPPQDIIRMLDKYQCQRQLNEQGVETPRLLLLNPSFEQLVAQMHQSRCFQVFVKTRFGSSATGVMALRIKPGAKQMVAFSSLTCEGYNSLKVGKYTDISQIKTLFELIMAEQGYVEQWIPKPQLHNESFDLRVVVIAGKAGHIVARSSRTPITNLHLGNNRGQLDKHPQAASIIKTAKATAEQSAEVFQHSGCFGADIICTGNKGLVLELNAFGDLLPGIEHNGMDTYQSQLNPECFANA